MNDQAQFPLTRFEEPQGQPQALTEEQLARYLGQECAYEYYHEGQWIHTVAYITADMLIPQVRQRIRDIRPYLRPLSTMTEAEAREVFRLAFEGGRTYRHKVYDVEDLCENGIALIGSFAVLEIYNDGQMRAYDEDYERANNSEPFNAVAVTDFLRSAGFDLEGLLEKGLAIQKGGQPG